MKRVLASLLLVACTGGSSTPEPASTSGSASSGSSGSSGASGKREVVVPQAILTGTLAGDGCRAAGPLDAVGDFGPPALPVRSGDSWEGQPATITCAIHAAGDKLEVVSSVTLGRSTIALDGSLGVTGEQPNVHVTAQVGGAKYEDHTCFVRYTDPSQGVAAGPFWGTISCPKAADATTPNASCTIEAQLRLENCTQ